MEKSSGFLPPSAPPSNMSAPPTYQQSMQQHQVLQSASPYPQHQGNSYNPGAGPPMQQPMYAQQPQAYYGSPQPAPVHAPTGAAYGNVPMVTNANVAGYQVVVPIEQGKFDAAARFDKNAPPSIPPPPPGCVPNAAQISQMGAHQAAAAGQIPPNAKVPIAVQKKKGNFLGGSGSGGFTFW